LTKRRKKNLKNRSRRLNRPSRGKVLEKGDRNVLLSPIFKREKRITWAEVGKHIDLRSLSRGKKDSPVKRGKIAFGYLSLQRQRKDSRGNKLKRKRTKERSRDFRGRARSPRHFARKEKHGAAMSDAIRNNGRSSYWGRKKRPEL